MRQIKFRGKDLETCDWVYGDLEIHRKDSRRLIHSYNADGDYSRQYDVDEETIGQFTGLYDSRNTPIYEGDIIQSKGSKHLIGYSVEDARFYCILTQYVGDEDFERCERCGLDQKWINGFGKVVIGNKYDNPKLLK